MTLEQNKLLERTGSLARSTRYFHFFIIFFVGLFVYISSINAPFYLDDESSIVKNIAVHLDEVSYDGFLTILRNSNLSNRPVVNFSFALNYIFNQDNPKGYHYVNIIVHILTGIFLYKFIEIAMRSPAMQGRKNVRWLALWSALIWLVHPVQTQAVTYIVQRMTSMASMFYILSLLCYAYARVSRSTGGRILWFAACFLSGVLALGSKEIAVTLPFFILLYEWFFYRDCNISFVKKILPYLVIACSVLLFGYFFNLFSLSWIFSGYEFRNFSLVERLLTEPRVVLFYISLLLFPYPGRLSLEHDFSISNSLINPLDTVFAIILLFMVFIGSCFAARRHRMYSFAVLWLLGNLVLESSVIPLEIVFEHRIYLPSMLVFIFVPAFIARCFLNKYLVNGVLFVVLLVLSSLTIQRNNIWAKPLLFHQGNVKNAPSNYRSYYNFGHYYLSIGNFGEAISYLEKAMEMEPRFLLGYKDLGFAYIMAGKYEYAQRQYLRILPDFPDDPEVYYYLGVIFRERGEREEAIRYFNNVVRLEPEHRLAHTNLGNLYVATNRYELAIPHFLSVLRVSGANNFAVQVDLGNCYAKLGKYEKALEHYSIALQIEPNHERLSMNINLAKQRLKIMKGMSP